RDYPRFATNHHFHRGDRHDRLVPDLRRAIYLDRRRPRGPHSQHRDGAVSPGILLPQFWLRVCDRGRAVRRSIFRILDADSIVRLVPGGLGLGSSPSTARTRPIVSSRLATSLLLHGVLLLGALACLVPFVWSLSASIKTFGDMMVYPPVLIPA